MNTEEPTLNAIGKDNWELVSVNTIGKTAPRSSVLERLQVPDVTAGIARELRGHQARLEAEIAALTVTPGRDDCGGVFLWHVLRGWSRGTRYIGAP